MRARTLAELTVAGLLEGPATAEATGEKAAALPPEAPVRTIPPSSTVGQ